MASTDFLPSNIDAAWDRLVAPGAMKSFLSLVSNPAMCSFFDDFVGDAVNAIHPANGGTGTQVVGITAAPNGTLTITTQGNQATDSGIQSICDLNWNGDLGFYMAARAKVSTLTDIKFSLGMSDAQADTGPINSKGSATFHASDLAAFSFDTADDTNLTLQTNGGSTDLNTDITAFTIAADTYAVFEIKAQDNNVSFYVNGKYVGGGTEIIEGGVAMQPYFYAEQNDTAAVTMTVDWVFITGPRT